MVWQYSSYKLDFLLSHVDHVKKISITYPLVELTTGLIFCANFFAYPSIYDQLPQSFIIFSGIILVQY